MWKGWAIGVFSAARTLEAPGPLGLPTGLLEPVLDLPMVFPARVAGKIVCKKRLIYCGWRREVALCPLYPRKQTSDAMMGMSAMGQCDIRGLRKN